MMAGARWPLSGGPLGALGFICPPDGLGRVSIDAGGVGSKHGDDREKPRPWEMAVGLG